MATPAATGNDWPDNYQASTAWWTVAIVMIFNVVSMIDRQIIAILIPEMRADLGLNDFQISLVQGLSFALFYGGMGLVIGGLVDRHSRRTIMFFGVAIWSLAAAASGLARNYIQLFLARLFVGCGEGAISPAAQSLLSSIFPRHRLTTPMACFTASGVIGMSLSYALGGHLLQLFSERPLGGWFADLAPWRQVLVVTGLPGIVIALLAFAVREPVRGDRTRPTAESTGWGPFFRHLRQDARLLGGIIVGSGVVSMAIQGSMAWVPTYARRVLGVGAAEIGTMMSGAVALGGIFGGLALGLFIDRQFGRGRRDITLRLFCIFALVVPPLVALAFVIGDFRLLFFAITLLMMTMGATFGPTMALVQMVAPLAMRGRLAALTVLSSNVFGYAIGPMLVGFLTDYVFADSMKIGFSIISILLVGGPVSALLVWSARRDFLQRVNP